MDSVTPKYHHPDFFLGIRTMKSDEKEHNEFMSVVCFVDILGFSSMKPDVAARKAQRFREIVYKWVIEKSIPLPGREKDYLNRPRFSVISDAIFITLTPETLDGVPTIRDTIRLVSALSYSMCECIMEKEEIPIRGSITVGRIDTGPVTNMDGRHLVGKPIVEIVKFLIFSF